MTTIRFALVASVTTALLAVPLAADAKKQRSSRHHHSSGVLAPSYASPGASVAPSRPTYGSSGPAIGTVTAPSIGTYNWPSVGVTNAVPTWSNTTR